MLVAKEKGRERERELLLLLLLLLFLPVKRLWDMEQLVAVTAAF